VPASSPYGESARRECAGGDSATAKPPPTLPKAYTVRLVGWPDPSAMSTVEHVPSRAQHGKPTLRRPELGFLPRQLRTGRGLSIDHVTERAMFFATKLSQLETGRVGASPRDIRDLYTVYGITDAAERERLMALAREGKQRACWQQFDLPHATYAGLEAEAASINDYNPDIVPGLLQVEGYARVIVESGDPPLGPAAIEHRIEARIRRRTLLARDDGLLFRCIVDEGALRRRIGALLSCEPS
jgi:transcriptional regulator with XRE-family HTH domain